MKKFRTTVSVIIMILAGIAGFFCRFGCYGRNGRRNTFFNDCGHRLHSLYGGQPRLIIVGRVKRYY